MRAATDSAGWVAVVAVVVAVLALVLAAGAQARLTRVRRALLLLRGHAGDGDVLELVTRQTAELVEQRRQLAALTERLEATRMDVAASLRHVAVVRSGADTPDSFSAALVDDAGDGLVLTATTTPGEPTRTTAKGVTGGRSDLPLSPEEARAVRAATSDQSNERDRTTHPRGPR